MRVMNTWILVLFAGLLVGCQDRRSKEIAQIRQTEQGVRPFNPAALHDPTLHHVALKFEIIQDSLAFLQDSVFLRPGRMPYRPAGAAGFLVTFRNSAGDTVEGYSMEDPRTVRSCDIAPGMPGRVILRTSGQVEILAPADTTIASVVLRTPGGKVQDVPIGTQIKLVVP